MELSDLVAALSRPAAYPHAVADVVVHHTHISVVFLAGPRAYKVKKPLDLGFLDFTTLERRRRFCLEETRVNRRLAPGVYEGVVPITAGPGGVRVGAETVAEEPGGDPAETVEYAVRMERLPDEATLEARLAEGALAAGDLTRVARRIAAFHAAAEGGPRVAAGGRLAVVAGNARENFAQSRPQVGRTVSAAVHARLAALTERELARLAPLVEDRARRGVPRDTHGDLRLDHVYLFPGRPPPADLVVVDAIEFNERFRHADPVADAAFLAMDLVFAGRRDLARAFAEAYLVAAGDEEGRALLPFYVAYRAAIRAKVEGMEALESDVPAAERDQALRRSRAFWLVALGQLEEPGHRPALLLVGGLPGTGKSTLAAALARRAGFCVVAADRVRKELAGLDPEAPAPATFGEGVYAPEWTERTYAECLGRAQALLFEGERVLVDATFREDHRRTRFLAAAREAGVPAAFLCLTTGFEVALRRLGGRRGGPSDADAEVYRAAAERWEPCGRASREALREIPAEDRRAALRASLAALAELEVLDASDARVAPGSGSSAGERGADG